MGRSARFKCNFLPFLSGSGEKRQLSKSRWTGFGSEQPEFAARQTATPEFAQRKNRDIKPLAVKVLKVLRGLLLEKSPKQGLGQSPKVLSNIHPKQNDPRVVPSSQ